jgi:hypothetical protein
MDRAEPGAVPYLRNAADGEVMAGTDPRKPNNLRTALLVGALALFFFVMFFVKRIWLS